MTDINWYEKAYEIGLIDLKTFLDEAKKVSLDKEQFASAIYKIAEKKLSFAEGYLAAINTFLILIHMQEAKIGNG